MIYGVLDASTREITLVSAGHPRPLLINGECSFVSVDTGFPLGLGTSSYPQHTLRLDPGTQLLLYSDGITEAMDRHNEEFGPARLMEHFLRQDACVEGLMEEVQRFSFGSDRSDDATVVLICSR
jgi:phosphoserine phosphatase RsbU/P